MGQKHSCSNDFGDLAIELSKPYYFSGDIVEGNIYLHITQSGFQAEQLTLALHGMEQCSWINGTDGPSFEGKHHFYRKRIVIHEFANGLVQVGQYKFPFQVHLLPLFPGSVKRRAAEWMAFINYYFEAIIKSKQPERESMIATKRLILRQHIPQDLKTRTAERTETVKTCCCFNQGEAKIKCTLNQDSFLAGDTALLEVEIDNSKGKADIKNIQVKLMSIMRLKSTENRQDFFSDEIGSTLEAGLPAGQVITKVIQIQLVNQNVKDKVLIPSAVGKLVKSTYELIVDLKISTWFCGTVSPYVKLPIHIYAPVTQKESLIAPQNWNPQEFRVTVLECRHNDNSNFTYQEMQVDSIASKF